MTQVHARALTSTQIASGTAVQQKECLSSSETTWLYFQHVIYLTAGIAPRNGVESPADAAVSVERHSRRGEGYFMSILSQRAAHVWLYIVCVFSFVDCACTLSNTVRAKTEGCELSTPGMSFEECMREFVQR